MGNVRPIAIYLPQFHPIPENDKWWGKGFTEWTNVTKAKPLFEGHYQPHLPADLGFYDLRLPEARQAQVDLAKEYGIAGFCYYHYWFNGQRILERPFQEVFESGKPDFPFMLCWANENWSRTWDGNENEYLLKQNYREEDDRNHINALIPYFKDSRYIKIDGKPVFIIYKSDELPNPANTIKVWKEEANKQGIDLYICRIERWTGTSGAEALSGFDAAIDFQPLSPSLLEYLQRKPKQDPERKSLTARGVKKIENLFTKSNVNSPEPQIGFDMAEYVEFDIQREPVKYKCYSGVSPMWDNSARRKKEPLIFRNSSPALYFKWLSEKLASFVPYSKDENFIFINAWNEWAEGNHLEPCTKWGRQYLEATKAALDNLNHTKNSL